MSNSKDRSVSDIDFVIIWLDSSDPEWLELRRKYQNEEDKTLNINESRFRDWGLLKYWFRGVERYAPWVRRVHLVTCGHYPSWLNLDNPKLHLVKHSDYMPAEYLPTFSSFPIELNLHRIEGLSDKFVYFNDDMFLVNPTTPGAFFKDGLPRDLAIRTFPMLGEFGHINLSCINLINREFYFKEQMKKNWWKWISPLYGPAIFRDFIFLPFGDFTGVINKHVANSYLKSTFETVWEKYGDVLDKTCRHRFRSTEDVCQWVFKFWQIVSGNFKPQRYGFGDFLTVNDTDGLKKYFKNKRTKVVCLNDIDNIKDIGNLKSTLVEMFEAKFPDRSSFEI